MDLIFFVLIVLVIIVNRIFTVKELCFAIKTRLDKRLKDVLLEGPHWVWPWEKVKPENVFSLEPQILPIKFTFFSEDRRELIFSGVVQWRADPDIVNPEKSFHPGLVRFFEVSRETLKEGLTSKIESEIGRFGGLHPWNVFINARRPIEHFMNSILRLEKPPHIDPDKSKVDADYLSEKTGEVLPDKRLDFYKDYSGLIGSILRHEKEEIGEHSRVEELYGINIVAFTIDEITFSPETKQALGAAERAKDDVQAAAVAHEKKISMGKELKEFGLNPEDAISSSELSLGQAVKNIHSIEGLKEFKLFGGQS